MLDRKEICRRKREGNQFECILEGEGNVTIIAGMKITWRYLMCGEKLVLCQLSANNIDKSLHFL